MARVKSHVTRVQNGFKLSQNGYDGFRNSPEHSRGPCVPTHRPKGPLCTLITSCENSHTRESGDPGVIIFIIFFRPAISLLGPDETLIFHHELPWALEVCTNIERSPFSPRARQGQIVALRIGRFEGRHCCCGACVNKVQPKSALAARPVPRDLPL